MTPPHMSWRSSRVRLTGENPAAARERYRYYLQQALACIHPTAYFYMSKTPLSEEWALATTPAPISLKVPNGRVLYLTAAQSFRVRKHKGEWKASALEYIYNVGETEDTRDYMFAWHWHPNQWGPECHLHASAELSNQMKLTRKHLPTARISFEEVLWFLINEFDVEPAQDLAECRRVLSETRRRHEQHRSWWGSRKP
jgi:hypothetical protein